MLETVPMFEDHTGQIIANAVVDILDNLDLETSKPPLIKVPTSSVHLTH